MTNTADGRAGQPVTVPLGRPRLHLRCTDSTNERARGLALGGAPHGTLVTTAEQKAGRGRQGRAWVAPAGSALLCSLVLRDPPPLLSLLAGVAVCDVVGERARVKWPNDIVVEGATATQPSATAAQPSATAAQPGATATQPSTAAAQPRATDPQPGDTVARPGAMIAGESLGDYPRDGAPNAAPLEKLAGILVEGRPQEGWAVLGIGLNVSLRVEQLPEGVRERAASLELPSSAVEPLLDRLLQALERRLTEPVEGLLDAWRARDALLGRVVSWGVSDPGSSSSGLYSSCGHGGRRAGQGRAAGIDEAGRLVVELADGSTAKLDAGEVHLGPAQ